MIAMKKSRRERVERGWKEEESRVNEKLKKAKRAEEMQRKLDESKDERLEWSKRMEKLKAVVAWRERELGRVDLRSVIEAKLHMVKLLLEAYQYVEAKSTLAKVEKYWNQMSPATLESTLELKRLFAEKVFQKNQKDGLRIYEEMAQQLEQRFGRFHKTTLEMKYAQADKMCEADKVSESKRMYRRIAESISEEHGDRSTEAMEAYWKLAAKLIKERDIRGGKQILVDILKKTEEVREGRLDYSKVVEAKEKLAHFYENNGEMH